MSDDASKAGDVRGSEGEEDHATGNASSAAKVHDNASHAEHVLPASHNVLNDDAPCPPQPKDTPVTEQGSPSPTTSPKGVAGSVAIPTPTLTEAHPTSAAAGPPKFVAPSSYLRPLSSRGQQPAEAATAIETGSRPGSSQRGSGQMSSPLDREQLEGLRAIRAFLKVRTSYDVLPLSYRLIVFDTSLLVKKSLNILTQQGIVSAPLWDSKTSTFAGLLTTSDYINVVQYYWQNPDALAQVDQFKLNSLREIERAIGVTPLETVSIHPNKPLYEACRRMLESRARRIPLVDVDDETRREMVVSVVTQYRILKFVSVNVKETQMLRKPLRDIACGTFTDITTARMDTPVMDVIHQLVKRNISCVPILDKEGTVLNVFEAVDVISLIKGGDYDNLNLSAGKALTMRSEDFPGIYTCTLSDRLDTIFDTIRKSRVHRLVVIDERNKLKGVLSLSDILDYTLNSPLDEDHDDK
ncbi:AMP-activated serine/threonine-protein kinase regulatory subunit [Recurvomyces mirabilis]|uniref:AMP-activated serine/threonine-protein kinase regulatory subunit n=1 Tax=Recurvomyces mirabilis TaxID=574656 RepID=A0AAE1C6N3_9PEZI|nr:AMP-activated serine/threonine-protein kinase regulatory subunit [Recurvomyces mirabilis]KAK5162210.1 AMP-activated serine/threonine-protein kinase regulatory subunit [Recurvomyces mirabilis]